MTLRGGLLRLPTLLLVLQLLLSLTRATQSSFDYTRDLQRREPPPEPPAPHAANPKRAEVGTKDAPVDGRDGKPHAGPFVKDPLWVPPEAVREQGQKDGLQVAEDGVMNDPNRTPPRKGTTGTEGGVSEKERDRKAQEAASGPRVPKQPDLPKPATGSDKTAAEAPDSHHEANPPSKGHGHVAHDDPKSQNYHHDDDDDDRDDDDDEDEEEEDEDGVHDFIPWDSLAGSFSSIAATEIGDKTFIVAALMAMRHSRLQVFSAAFSALFIMTILSGVAGHALGALISKRWSALVAALLFLVFGAKSLREGAAMSPDQGVSDEIKEVEAELEEKEEDMRHANGGRRSSISPYALEAGRAPNGRKSRSRSRLAAPQRSPSSSTSRSRSPTRPTFRNAVSGIKNLLSLILSPAWVETFSMTFIGELGDRSQIATVAMAAGQEYYWVMIGASLGHFVCTGVAVLGGSVLAGRVSLRKVTLVGGGIFVAFGIFTLIEAVQYW